VVSAHIINAIKELQRSLHVPDDGLWGPITDNAVKEFQASRGIYLLHRPPFSVIPVCAGCEDKLIERLQAADISGHGEYSALAREAANEIKRLRVEVSELRKRRH
jgi:hypothetical protein